MSNVIGRVIDTDRNERIRALVALGLNSDEIGQRIGLSHKTVNNHVRNYQLGPWINTRRKSRPASEIPDDFAAKFAAHTRADLKMIYGRSNTTITAWVNRLGLPKKRYNGARATPAKHLPRTHKAWRPTLTGRQPVDRAHRDETPAGMAADYLRRFGPVIRCNAKGEYQQNGDHWLRGHTILTADEVIDRAERNGWTAWRLAA